MNVELLVIVVSVAPLSLVLLYQHPALAWLIFLIAYLLPVTVVELDTRPLAIVALATQLFRVTRHAPQPIPAFVSRNFTATWCLVALLLASVAWSADRVVTVSASSAWILLLVALATFANTLGIQRMLALLGLLSAALLIMSILFIVGSFEVGYAGGRARGVFGNANGLGVLVALFTPVIFGVDRRSVRILGLVCVGIALFASASRGGALSALVGAAVFVWMSGSALVKAVALPAALGGGWWLSSIDWSRFSSDTGLLRTNDSRSEVWADALASFTQNPYFGSGFGTHAGLGSSYLKVAAETGLLGILCCSIFAFALFSVVRRSVTAVAVLAAGLTNAVFEGWLLAAGSFYCLLFFALCLLVVGHESTATQGRERLENDRMDGQYPLTPVR